MTTYTDNFGANTPYHSVFAIVIPASGSVRVPENSTEIDAPSDLSKSGNVWSSTTGGLLTFYTTDEDCFQEDGPGVALAANTADHTAL